MTAKRQFVSLSRSSLADILPRVEAVMCSEGKETLSRNILRPRHTLKPKSSIYIVMLILSEIQFIVVLVLKLFQFEVA
jgi:hypothetical protein